MTEEEQKAADLAEDKRKTDLEKSNAALKEKSTNELIDIIHSTRTEAKTYRLELRDIKSDVDLLKGEKEKEDQAKKIAEGKKDEVIADLTTKNEGLIKRANEWDNYNTNKRNVIKTNIGDNWLDSFSTMPLSDLEILATKFNGAKEPIDTDTGQMKKTGSARLEILRKDLALAMEKRDLPAQLSIRRMIDEEVLKVK